MEDCMILCTQEDVYADTKQPTDIPDFQILLATHFYDEEDIKGDRHVQLESI